MENVGPGSSEQIYRQIVDNARDAVIFADAEGVIRVWNSGAETIFGYQATEALGQTLDLIIPERFQERHWEGYRKVMATGVTKYTDDMLAVPAAKSDGTRISLEFTITLLKGEDGDVQGIAAIVRDITERFQQERATAKRIEELESRLGNEAAS
ncbi:MAG: PAS domain S-box protein [SAR202 cluster bacterium]|jgi:PAS domain S-box-containing protein|nr:histidine kinase [Chloroflexota bacterium]MDP6421010.1 PAS domain S-box protein [SAR202 cluster bacterium]HAL47292.1 histidine kinase [Dehalococcoidia bacterium]MDP6663753.1 PAS domain S-box protein [SAR202 cluster bacterium]MDP6799061.1 PAS domain S-box protein [SAR202 cluster bacterium]|tara:strand:+ start:2328 stop:2789 length:462 start_codon:yes stop_codon:yes gene_type:complete